MGGMTLASTAGDGMVKLWQANLDGVWHEQAVLDCSGSHVQGLGVSENIFVPSTLEVAALAAEFSSISFTYPHELLLCGCDVAIKIGSLTLLGPH